MNKKTIGTIVLLVLIGMSGLLQACQKAPPLFETLSLDIMPPKVTTGEKATVEVEIRNSNAKMDKYNVPLMVNGVADDRKSITLAPGDTELITFILTKSQAGTYRVSVGNKEATLVVENPSPPDFRLSGLNINPSEVDTCEKVTVTAKVANVGGTQGTYTAELKIDGITDQTEKITISAGADYMLILEVCRGLPGTYAVALGDLAGQFTVKEPPKPVVNNSTSSSPSSLYCDTNGYRG
jgi:hypothetical protein